MADAVQTPRFQARDMVRDRATTLRFTAVMGLQMGQVLPQAFIGLMLPVIYREHGLALDMWWVFTLPLIPTYLRPLWAPFIDRTGSRTFGMRRSWFIPCTTMGALAYVGMSLWDPTIENLVIVIALWTLKSAIMTTQDVAIDGYMVENIRDEERPVAAGVLDIARNIGMFVSWVGIAWIYDAYGWTTAMVVASTLLIGFSMPGILRPEPPRPRQFEHTRPSLKNLLARRESYYIYPLCLGVALTGGMIATLYPTYLSDLGFRAAEVATMVGPATLIGTVIGASAATWFLSRFGYLRAFLISAVMMALAIVPIIWMGSLEAPTYAVVFGVTLNGIALPSFLTVTFQAARLKWASKSQAATDYTTQIVTMAAGSALATSIGGVVAHNLGWFWHFAIGGTATIAMCVTLYLLYEKVEAIVEERDRRELEATS
jgi:PAT family beta-lactamase induction signal transducer AmpG